MEHAPFFAGLFSFLKLVTIFAFVLGIIFISKMGGRSRRHGWREPDRSLSREDEAFAGDLSRIAERLEKRVDALEKILEAEDPKWKDRAP